MVLCFQLAYRKFDEVLFPDNRTVAFFQPFAIQFPWVFALVNSICKSTHFLEERRLRNMDYEQMLPLVDNHFHMGRRTHSNQWFFFEFKAKGFFKTYGSNQHRHNNLHFH